MIKPRPYGHDIETIRDDGALRIIPVHRGCERRAFRLILAYRKAGLLTFDEAARAMCAMNAITEQPAAGPRALSPPAGSREWRRALAAFRGLVSRTIDGIGAWLGRDEADSCCGK